MQDNFGFNQKTINLGGVDGDDPITDLQVVTGRTVEFRGSIGGTNPDSLFIWDFGDENGSSASNPNMIKTKTVTSPVRHLFSIAGKYVVRLIEQRKDGIILEAVKTVKIFT